MLLRMHCEEIVSHDKWFLSSIIFFLVHSHAFFVSLSAPRNLSFHCTATYWFNNVVNKNSGREKIPSSIQCQMFRSIQLLTTLPFDELQISLIEFKSIRSGQSRSARKRQTSPIWSIGQRLCRARQVRKKTKSEKIQLTLLKKTHCKEVYHFQCRSLSFLCFIIQ